MPGFKSHLHHLPARCPGHKSSPLWASVSPSITWGATDIQVFAAWPGSSYSFFFLLSVFISHCHKIDALYLNKITKSHWLTKKKVFGPTSVGGPLIPLRLAWDDTALFHVPLIFLGAGLGRCANTPLVTSPALPTVERWSDTGEEWLTGRVRATAEV